jgi:hypothetical protein
MVVRRADLSKKKKNYTKKIEIGRRRRSKSELSIPKRASATATSLQGRLRANTRRGGGGVKARNTGRGRETSASPSHKTRAARCEKRGMKSSSSLPASEGAAAPQPSMENGKETACLLLKQSDQPHEPMWSQKRKMKKRY